MKATVLIARLRELTERHGDVNVVMADFDGEAADAIEEVVHYQRVNVFTLEGDVKTIPAIVLE